MGQKPKMALLRGVMAETGQPADKTINLARDFLGASDQKNLSAEGARSAPSMGTHGSDLIENDDFSLSNSDKHMLHAAAAAERGEGSSFILPGTKQGDASNPRSEAEKRKKREENNQTQMTLAEQARILSEQLARHIAELESAFETKYGDAWREHIANKVMEPDEIPERREGESMQDYRERLEAVLIATMIDPATGKIKPEYANSDDPDVLHYAEWAQAQHRQRQIENASESELEQIISESQDLHDVRIAGNQMVSEGEGPTTASSQKDELYEEVADAGTESAFLLVPKA